MFSRFSGEKSGGFHEFRTFPRRALSGTTGNQRQPANTLPHRRIWKNLAVTLGFWLRNEQNQQKPAQVTGARRFGSAGLWSADTILQETSSASRWGSSQAGGWGRRGEGGTHCQHPSPKLHICYSWWTYTDTSLSLKFHSLH